MVLWSLLAASASAHAQTSLRTDLGGTLGYGEQLIPDGEGWAEIDVSAGVFGGVILFESVGACEMLIVGRNGSVGCDAGFGSPADPVSDGALLAAFWTEIGRLPPSERSAACMPAGARQAGACTSRGIACRAAREM